MRLDVIMTSSSFLRSESNNNIDNAVDAFAITCHLKLKSDPRTLNVLTKGRQLKGGKETEILEKQDTQVEDASFEAILQFGIVPKNYGEIA